ncbi:response regulator [bacterium]|nr:response regulator [bacterium]
MLVVDDEASVRKTTKRMLEKMGFEILAAKNGREALEIFDSRMDDISCVLLDLTMPDMDGKEAFRKLRNIQADAKIIISSGYSEQDVVERFAGMGLTGFIHKPYMLGTLMKKLQQILTDMDKQ